MHTTTPPTTIPAKGDTFVNPDGETMTVYSVSTNLDGTFSYVASTDGLPAVSCGVHTGPSTGTAWFERYANGVRTYRDGRDVTSRKSLGRDFFTSYA